MKRSLIAYGLLTTLALPGSAYAATTITYAGTGPAVIIVGNPATPYSEMVYTNGVPDSKSLALTTKPGANNVIASSTNTLSASGQGSGYATISGINGLGFSDITINPTNPFDYFTAMSFTLGLMSSTGGASQYNFDVKITTLSGIETIQNVAFMTQKDKFDVIGSILLNANELIDKITIYGLEGPLIVNNKVVTGKYANYNFASIKQISFAPRAYIPPPVAAVPEPGTWALMLVGFGLLGGALRRRKQNVRVKFV